MESGSGSGSDLGWVQVQVQLQVQVPEGFGLGSRRVHAVDVVDLRNSAVAMATADIIPSCLTLGSFWVFLVELLLWIPSPLVTAALPVRLHLPLQPLPSLSPVCSAAGGRLVPVSSPAPALISSPVVVGSSS